MNIGAQIQNININNIIPNKSQPRLVFDDKSLQELANSIKEHGIIQPIILRQLGDKYEIIAGERRYRASVAAGLTEVPCIISDINDIESSELALTENIQRKNLNSIEEARAYKLILEQQNITQEELATRMGVAQSTVANKLRLLNLTEEVQDALLQDKISERHARSLLQISDSVQQIEMLNKTINERLTVRQLDDEIVKLNNPIVEESKSINNIPVSLNNVSDNIFDITPAGDNSFNPFNTSSENMFDLPENENNTTEPIKIEEIETKEEQVLEKDNKVEETIDGKNEDSESVNPFKNLFSSFDISNRPSLDDEVTNMVTDSGDDLFNNKNLDDKNNNSDSNVIIKEIEVPVEDPLYKIDPDNLLSVKTAYKHLCDEVKKAGYNLTDEEFDFEDLYQLIIKIDK